ncbi:hypothetical protein AgCh_012415 [Apium graveolens]
MVSLKSRLRCLKTKKPAAAGGGSYDKIEKRRSFKRYRYFPNLVYNMLKQLPKFLIGFGEATRDTEAMLDSDRYTNVEALLNSYIIMASFMRCLLKNTGSLKILTLAMLSSTLQSTFSEQRWCFLGKRSHKSELIA